MVFASVQIFKVLVCRSRIIVEMLDAQMRAEMLLMSLKAGAYIAEV